MLEPQDRHHLLELLRPPQGYRLSCGIGTTYSLDLVALLTAPLAFTFFEHTRSTGRTLGLDPLALLTALRRSAEHLSIFCQAGQIGVPGNRQPLLGYLENSVFEVKARNRGGIFHPKVWILRFVPSGPSNGNPKQAGEPVRYRLLCLTRNLTFDQSWDTALALDGAVIARKNAFSINHPLCDFFASLPKLTIRPLPDRVQKDIALVTDELRRVRFDLPAGFDEIAFWPLGHSITRRWPFTHQIDRMLVISPFVTQGMLTRLNKGRKNDVLVSRSESLDPLGPKCLNQFGGVYTLSTYANPEEVLEEEAAGELEVSGAQVQIGDEPVPSSAGHQLSGLHAKLYVADSGTRAHIWIGSANATDAAFNNNVEFLVELIGKKKLCGVGAMLYEATGQATFQSLLEAYHVPDSPVEVDPALEKLERSLEDAKYQLAYANLATDVTTESTSKGDGPTFRLRLHQERGEALRMPPGIQGRCWPVTLHEGVAVSLSAKGPTIAEFGPITYEAVTPFIAFELTTNDLEGKVSVRFVVNTLLIGAPEDRHERILNSLLNNRQDVLRFIVMLLSEGSDEALADSLSSLASTVRLSDTAPPQASAGVAPLLESLIRTLGRDPGKLDEIAELLADLSKNPDSDKRLPEGFDAIWKPVWAAREKIRKI